MQAVSRPCVLAAAAIAAVSTVVVAPVVARQVPLAVRQMETRLVDADSVLNIPVNLFDDILNIPSTEVGGFNVLGDSLLFSGDWWVPSATNLWGTDPGDLGHYMGLLDVLIPFKEISGLGQPEVDPTLDASGLAGLAQQIGLLAAAELPVSASCDAETCYPMTPPNVITGSTGFDRDIGFIQAFTGQDKNFTLFSDWLKVPLSDLTSGTYTFGSSDTGIVDPSPNAVNSGGVLGEFGFPGTVGTGDTAGDMPWNGDTFTLNLFGPFENFYNSLLATPATDGVGGTGIEIPTLTSITQDFQTFAAGLVVAFDPYVEGSPACPAECVLPANETQLALVQDILNWDPTNKDVATWVANYPDNNATLAEEEASVALLQTGQYNLTAAQLLEYDNDLTAINPELPYLFTNDGIVTDPNYLAYSDALVNGQTLPAFDPEYGGYNPGLVGEDYWTLLTNNEWNFSSLENVNIVGFLLDPAQGDPGLSAAAAVPAAADISGVDPSLSSDLSTLLASLGATVGSDAVSAAIADISAQISADLATIVPQSLLSLF
ncbi:MAG: hypothetical protein WB777_25295 [Mycobacterium sp.]